MIDDLQIYDGVLTSQEIKNMVFDPAIKVSGIGLGLAEKRISVGNTFTPSSVSVSPAFAGNQALVWSSADPSIATVDEISGQVTAVKGRINDDYCNRSRWERHGGKLHALRSGRSNCVLYVRREFIGFNRLRYRYGNRQPGE